MRELLEKIAAEGEVAADGVLKVDRFLNHQVDPQLMKRIGEAFAVRFRDERPTKVLTLESSGISPALMAAYELGIPLVVARKRRPLTMTGDVYRTEVYSFTKQEANEIIVSRSLLGRGDRVLIIDDFLANGQAALGMVEIIEQAGADMVGIGIVIEKAFQDGGRLLRSRGFRVVSLARIASLDGGAIQFADEVMSR
ncbi:MULTISPECIES: xanthine phosphoribosyltransferase [Geobacillus]|uniref:Xanthine phosphoribosyltransferase n=1 Tax=Geobacillus thermocatenulatus TaxID=33938 RepID=A0A226Q146_9BACL|nr:MULTISPECIES: xanthine phosphoribosyltransferase [Geobacillus]ALA72022.1 xanthine phosphoribosyltransferase [Geobacillus stearothermophilus 10]RAN23203.1 xanthine phosphoribosyltransferase [Geobacillus sp. A8]ADI26948.1 xanthine phosphoribosyltransferase [Geobacillus sp. C56-T3]ADU93963.1 xanthine phosphoribosyltransferase [Geobacillus sp. Y412MC52]ASS99621.1 xanthine phosphoribosyltransferase [Geobacillus thermocatenulatus]